LGLWMSDTAGMFNTQHEMKWRNGMSMYFCSLFLAQQETIRILETRVKMFGLRGFLKIDSIWRFEFDHYNIRLYRLAIVIIFQHSNFHSREQNTNSQHSAPFNIS
jgi:hypothetical protein